MSPGQNSIQQRNKVISTISIITKKKMKRLTPNPNVKKLSSFNTHTEHPTWPTKHEGIETTSWVVWASEAGQRLTQDSNEHWPFFLFSVTREQYLVILFLEISQGKLGFPHTHLCIFSQLGTVWREKRKEQQVQQQTKKNSPLNFLICWENPWGFYTTSLRQFL